MNYVLKSERNKCFYILEGGEIVSDLSFGQIFANVMNTLDSMLSHEKFIDSEWEIFSEFGDAKPLTIDAYEDFCKRANIDSWRSSFENMQNEVYDCLSQRKNGYDEILRLYNKYRFLPLLACDSDLYEKYFEKLRSDMCDFEVINDIISDRLHYIGPHFYNGDMCEILAYKEYFDLFVLDFWEVLTHKDVHAKICKHCKRVFYPDSRKIKFCDQCKKNYGHIRYSTRMSDDRQALTKKILDTAYNKFGSDDDKHGANEWTFNFLQESNYYRSIVVGDDVEVNPDYRSDIKTMNDYISWLESTLEFVKSYKKNK